MEADTLHLPPQVLVLGDSWMLRSQGANSHCFLKAGDQKGLQRVSTFKQVGSATQQAVSRQVFHPSGTGLGKFCTFLVLYCCDPSEQSSRL